MSTKSSAGKVAEGLGMAALAAGAAAAYYFSGKSGQAKRKQAKAWAKKAQTELVQKIKQMEKVSKATYEQAAKEVLAKYKQVKNIDPKELAAFSQELKGHWNQIAMHAEKLAHKPATAKKAPAKKSSKKATK